MSHHYPRHHQLTVVLHWLTFFTIFAVLGAVLSRELIEDDDIRLLLLDIHRSLGVLVLLLVAVRVVMRYFYYFSHVTAQLPKALRRMAGAAHLTIYSFLFIVPITGWLFTSASGKSLTFFGLIKLPLLMQKNRDLADQLDELHEIFAWIFIVAIVGHIFAALWHHYVRKDHVLRSILPARQIKE